MGLTRNQEIMVGLAVVGGLAFMTLGSSKGSDESAPLVVDDDPEMPDAPKEVKPWTFKYEPPPFGAIPPLDKKKPKDAKQIAFQIIAEQQQRFIEEYKILLTQFETRWSQYSVKRTEFWQFFQTVQETGMKKFPMADIAKLDVEWLFKEATELHKGAVLLHDDTRANDMIKDALQSMMATLAAGDQPLWTKILQADKSAQVSDFQQTLPHYTNVTNNHNYKIRTYATIVKPEKGGEGPSPMDYDSDDDKFNVFKKKSKPRRGRSRSPKAGRKRASDAPGSRSRTASPAKKDDGRLTDWSSIGNPAFQYTPPTFPPPLNNVTDVCDSKDDESAAFNQGGDGFGSHAENKVKEETQAKQGTQPTESSTVANVAGGEADVEMPENKKRKRDPIPEDFDAAPPTKYVKPNNDDIPAMPGMDAPQKNIVALTTTDEGEMEDQEPAPIGVLGKRKGGIRDDFDSAKDKTTDTKKQKLDKQTAGKAGTKFMKDGAKKVKPVPDPLIQVQEDSIYMDRLSSVYAEAQDILIALDVERNKPKTLQKKMKDYARRLFMNYEIQIQTIPTGGEEGSFVSTYAYGTRVKGQKFIDSPNNLFFQRMTNIETISTQIPDDLKAKKIDGKLTDMIAATDEYHAYFNNLKNTKASLKKLHAELWQTDTDPMAMNDFSL